jgi:fructan beta-fructosidase
VFWFAPNNEWVMVLYEEAGISFFTSPDLRTWQYESHVKGFYECPEFFPLPVDGDPGTILWVLTGASGSYLLGDFDGRVFTPRAGKFRTTYGSQYAAQTITDAPDGRRIMIGWGRIPAEGMPFNGMMCFPTELTLQRTNEGVRMFSRPVEGLAQLHSSTIDLSGMNAAEANLALQKVQGDVLHVVARLETTTGTSIKIDFQGNRVLEMDADEVNGVQVALPDPRSLVFDCELLIDRTSVEAFVQGGKAVFVSARPKAKTRAGLEFAGDPRVVRIHSLKVHELRSIWP